MLCKLGRDEKVRLNENIRDKNNVKTEMYRKERWRD